MHFAICFFFSLTDISTNFSEDAYNNNAELNVSNYMYHVILSRQFVIKR